jgi:hypothetical protein
MVVIEPSLPIPGRIASLFARPEFYRHRRLWIDGEKLVVLHIFDSRGRSPNYKVEVNGARIAHHDLCDVRHNFQNFLTFVDFP